jgi:ankyrin repeat protein
MQDPRDPIRRLSAVILALALPGAADDRADLSLAIRRGDLAAVRTIVAKSPALVTSADGTGFTPLHIAATAGRVNVIEFLLGRGADLEARTPGGQTPLFQTVPLASREAFVLLLGKGANLAARDADGRSILQFALAWQRPAMVDLILAEGFPVEATGAAAEEMLEEAANAGIASLVEALVAKGAPLATTPRRGTTLLHAAARGGLPRMAAPLLKGGVPVDIRDLHGLTPLHVAAFYGRDEVVRVLLAGGADLEMKGRDGRSARQLALDAGHEETAALLSSKGASNAPRVFPSLEGKYLGQPEPDEEPRIFAPGIVSSEEHETNVSFSPGGREICFSRINANQTRRWLLFMRLEDGRWTPPAPAPFGSEGTDFEASYSPDGRTLFFVSNRPLDKGGPPGRDTDIWLVERSGGGWGPPRNLGPAVNGPSNEYMPSADREGNLWFERHGLNVARRRSGKWLPAEPGLGTVTNVSAPGHPFVAPDGSYLLFDARPPGSGRSVLHASFRRRDGSWTPAVRLFEGAGTREYESCPSVSPDGRFLFFGRDHDIWWASAEIVERLRPAGP